MSEQNNAAVFGKEGGCDTWPWGAPGAAASPGQPKVFCLPLAPFPPLFPHPGMRGRTGMSQEGTEGAVGFSQQPEREKQRDPLQKEALTFTSLPMQSSESNQSCP